MSDIFLSYSMRDRERIGSLVELLEGLGWSVFPDLNVLAKKLDSYSGSELEKTRCVLVVWSEASIRSKWVFVAAREAMERDIIFPVFIDPVRPPFGFGGIHGEDLSTWSGEETAPAFQRLVMALERRLGAPPRLAEARPRALAKKKAISKKAPARRVPNKKTTPRKAAVNKKAAPRKAAARAKTGGKKKATPKKRVVAKKAARKESVASRPNKAAKSRPKRVAPRDPRRRRSGPAIFICYRRDDEPFFALWLADKLRGEFGPGQVFMDIDEIDLGEDFEDEIRKAIESVDVLIAIIGESWLTMVDKNGRRKLDDPKDYLRLELAAGLRKKGQIKVIPVLLKVSMPVADDLPRGLKTLPRRQALELSTVRGSAKEAERLIASIRRAAG